MGGGSFNHRAERLTTAQLDALEVHCIKTLRPFFKDIRALRNLDNKATHGDLDLMVGSEQMTRGIRWTGYDGGHLDFNEQSALVYNVRKHEDDGRERKMGNEHPVYAHWKAWFISIARAVQAVQWNRSGGTSVKVAVAIPCTIIEAHFGHVDGSEVSDASVLGWR